MNSPNVTTVPLSAAKGRGIGRIRADQAPGAYPGRLGIASKLGKIQSPQMGRIHRPLRRLSALAPSTMNRRAISGCSPRSIRSASNT